MSNRGIEVQDEDADYRTRKLWFREAFLHEPSNVLTVTTGDERVSYQFHLTEGQYTRTCLRPPVIDRLRESGIGETFSYRRKKFVRISERRVHDLTEGPSWRFGGL